MQEYTNDQGNLKDEEENEDEDEDEEMIPSYSTQNNENINLDELD
jgi:hypothetical protein